jgi:hypothetical protein
MYTLSLARARDSVDSHVTQIHSLKQFKFGQYAVWKHQQWIILEKKVSVGRREETVRHTLEVIAAPSRVRQSVRVHT